MASNAELNNSIIQLTRDVNDLTEAVNVKKQVLDSAVDDAEASETAAAASAAAAANSQTSASASAGAAAQSAANAAEVVTGGEGSLEPLPGKLPIADSRGNIHPGWLENVPSRAEFFARAALSRDQFGGSGFIEWGRHQPGGIEINNGLYVRPAAGSAPGLYMTYIGDNGGESRSQYPVVDVNGMRLILRDDAPGDAESQIRFPDAPDTSALRSRQDVVFVEVWHEKLADKDVVYPYGNVAFASNTWNGVSLSSGLVPESYSNAGAWETAHPAHYGLRWSSASADQRAMFLRDPANNIYVEHETGDLVQVRWRTRTVPSKAEVFSESTSVGLRPNVSRYFGRINPAGNDLDYIHAQWSAASLTDGDAGDFSAASSPESPVGNGNTAVRYGKGDLGFFATAEFGVGANTHGGDAYVIPIALVQRRNQGAYHPTYNPDGCAKITNIDGSTPAFWYETDRPISTADHCFSFASGGSISSAVSGRPDGKFYDEVNLDDVRDLRNDANRIDDLDRYLSKHFRKLISGKTRGWEADPVWRECQTDGFTSGDYVNGVSTAASALSGVTLAGTTIGALPAGTGSTPDTGREIGFALSPVSKTLLKIVVTSTFSTLSLRQPDDSAAASNVLDEFKSPATFLVYGVSRNGAQPASERVGSKAATILQCDVIGNPANYPSEWLENGVSGHPLVIDESGSRIYPSDVAVSSGTHKQWELIRKMSSASPFIVLRWDGSSWSRLNVGTADGQWAMQGQFINFYDSSWGVTFNDSDVFMVFYPSASSALELSDNSVVRTIGSAVEINYPELDFGVNLVALTTGKIPTVFGPAGRNLGSIKNFGYLPSGQLDNSATYRPKHGALSSNDDSPGAKFLVYLSDQNGKAYMNVIFKELRFHAATSNMGDTGEFEIVHKVAIATDANGNTVLVGQKRVELPAFLLGAQ